MSHLQSLLFSLIAALLIATSGGMAFNALLDNVNQDVGIVLFFAAYPFAVGVSAMMVLVTGARLFHLPMFPQPWRTGLLAAALAGILMTVIPHLPINLAAVIPEGLVGQISYWLMPGVWAAALIMSVVVHWRTLISKP
jgi:hypothetical protein